MAVIDDWTGHAFRRVTVVVGDSIRLRSCAPGIGSVGRGTGQSETGMNESNRPTDIRCQCPISSIADTSPAGATLPSARCSGRAGWFILGKTKVLLWR